MVSVFYVHVTDRKKPRRGDAVGASAFMGVRDAGGAEDVSAPWGTEAG